MATAGKLQHDHLTCSICIEVFQQPVSLACQHSFCKNCLTTYLETQTEAVTDKFIPCPTCRQETPVLHPERPVEEWAGQLKPGLLLIGLMDSLQETTMCYSCRQKGETTPATQWCSECEASFCDACLKMHRKMPALHNHVVGTLAEASSIPVIKRKFMCREHDEKMKLYCKDCKKPLCTVCCSISHRKCEDVVTIQEMLPEVKGQLQNRHTKLQMKMKECKTEVVGYEKEIEKGTHHKEMVQSEIEKTFERFMKHLLKKKEQLLKKLENQSGEQSDRIRSKVKTKQNDVQLYQKQAHCIQQALEFEDEAKLFDMYLSGSGAVSTVSVTEGRERTEVATISFVHDLEGLEEQVDKMDVKEEKKEVIDLAAEPILHTVIETKLHLGDACDLTDVAVLNSEDKKLTVVTDYNGSMIQLFYTLNGKQQCSTLTLDNFPWSIAVLYDDKVAVTVPDSRQIVTVNRNLELHSTISTDKEYHGLDVLDQSTLVASSSSPPSVDILDMEGRVMRSFQRLPEAHKSFRYPHYIHVTRQGTVLVSDWGLKSVICMTQTGHVVWIYTPTGDRALCDPRGVTSTSTGEVLVADRDTHTVVHLSESGEFIRDILTEKDGIEYPYSLCVDGDKLYVANQVNGICVYQFV